MGGLFEREYFRITEAAPELGCTVDDLIHYAAIGRISLGVLFTIDGFALEHYYYIEDSEKWVSDELVAEFTGFVYVDKGYFQDMELRDGELLFNSVVRMDGRIIGKKPIDDDYGFENRSLKQIYIHSNDLRKLLSASIPTTGDVPTIETDGTHVSDKLQYLRQAARKFWGSQNEATRHTHPDNADVVAWLIDKEFSKKQANAGASIIRPSWAPPGRKPRE